MSVVVDALGKQCPIPVVMAKKALAELQTPDTLEILVDNEAAVQNLSKLAASCQLPVRAEKTGEKRFSVTMEVSAPVQPAEETAVGATIVKREYEKLLAAEDKDIIITSCCHSVNLLIQK